MKHIVVTALALTLISCGNNDGATGSSVGEANDQCMALARDDEMRINVVRSDSRQMTDLEATFHFANSQEDWKCSGATLDGILCQAMPTMITIIASVGEDGDIRSIELADQAGFTYSGDVTFTWTDLPVSNGCANTYRPWRV